MYTFEPTLYPDAPIRRGLDAPEASWRQIKIFGQVNSEEQDLRIVLDWRSEVWTFYVGPQSTLGDFYEFYEVYRFYLTAVFTWVRSDALKCMSGWDDFRSVHFEPECPPSGW